MAGPKFRNAGTADIPAITALLNATAGALSARFGEGHWSSLATERSTEVSLGHGVVRVGVIDRKIVTTLRLGTKKPWAIATEYFTPVTRAMYLTGMGVSVARQRSGLGRRALEDAASVARAWPADAIRLDAYDAEAGAGGFYERCGFQERGRVVYRGVPHIYYELLLNADSSRG